MTVKKRKLLFSGEPLHDESFVGYLLRLVELNDFDSLSWALQMAEILEHAHHYGFVFDSSLNLAPLTSLTGVEEVKLRNLLYHTAEAKRRKMGDYLVFGRAIPQYAIRPERPKMCPGCLRESAHARRIWDLIPVTVCPIHKCLLIDECPTCGARLTWLRTRVTHCRCGYDWREYDPPTVGEPELEVTKQIYRLCKLAPKEWRAIDRRPKSSPIYKLDLQHFLSALFFVASQFGGFIDTKGKFFVALKRNAAVHALLTKALPAFDAWPDNFFAFLDWRRSQKTNEKFARGLKREFGEYKGTLYGPGLSEPLNFLREAFENYIVEHWDGGYTGHMRRLGDSAPDQKKYVPMQEAKRLLNTPQIYELITSGTLKAVVQRQGERNFVLVERASLVGLQTALERALGIKQLGSLLSLRSKRILSLVEAGILNPLRGPSVDGCAVWKFRDSEAEGILEKLRSRLSEPPDGEVLNFAMVLARLDHAGIKLSAFIRAVFLGRVRPCGLSNNKGLSEFIFSEAQVSDFILSNSPAGKDIYPVKTVARFLGVAEAGAYFLIKKGLLRAQQTAPSRSLMVRKSDLELFNSEFTLTGKLASELGTGLNYLLAVLMEQGVKAISGHTVDGGPVSIVKKSDLKTIDVRGLVSSAKSRGKILLARVVKENPLVDEAAAAEALGIDVDTIRQAVERGVIKPYKYTNRLTRTSDAKYYFSRPTVEKHRRLSLDYKGLISTAAAKKLFKMQSFHFKNKYVRTGRLEFVANGDRRGEYYFRMKDVEALLEIEGQTIMTPEVSQILGVDITAVTKMIVSGVLKPISGPSVDGFGKNLFLRDDIEKLREQREAFKARRVAIGGSSRFGRRAGPQASPVRDMIGPRIDQLLEEWQREELSQHISGQRLHQQLIREGYQVGVVSVYEYLRQKRPRAA